MTYILTHLGKLLFPLSEAESTGCSTFALLQKLYGPTPQKEAANCTKYNYLNLVVCPNSGTGFYLYICTSTTRKNASEIQSSVWPSHHQEIALSAAMPFGPRIFQLAREIFFPHPTLIQTWVSHFRPSLPTLTILEFFTRRQFKHFKIPATTLPHLDILLSSRHAIRCTLIGSSQSHKNEV